MRRGYSGYGTLGLLSNVDARTVAGWKAGGCAIVREGLGEEKGWWWVEHST